MREWNDIAVLAPARDIDLASVPGLRDEMDALVAAGGRRILVNCENVTFIDSTGLAFLLSRARRLMQEGGMLSLVNVSPEVARFLQIAQLLSVLHVTGREKPPVPVLSAGTPPLWSRSISVAEGVENLGLYRHRLVEMMEELPMGRDAVYDTALAAGEALGNAYDHAGGAGHFIRRHPYTKVLAPAKGRPHLVDPSKLIAGSRTSLGSLCDVYGEPLPVPAKRHYSNQCTLVLASSDAQLPEGIVPILYTLLKMFDFLHFVVIGNIAHNFQIPSERIRCYETCSEEQFSQLLSGIDNGIGLLPLDDSLFSSCKSPIKFWHYTSCGIVSVASDLSPYAQYIDNDVNGILLDNTPDAWCTALSRLIRDHRKRQTLLGNALKKWQTTASGKVAVEAWRALFAPLPQRPERKQGETPPLPDFGQEE